MDTEIRRRLVGSIEYLRGVGFKYHSNLVPEEIFTGNFITKLSDIVKDYPRPEEKLDEHEKWIEGVKKGNLLQEVLRFPQIIQDLRNKKYRNVMT